MHDLKLRHDRVSALFLAACGLEGDRRDDFLENSRSGDDALRQHVEALLVSNRQLPTLLRTGAMVTLGEIGPERLPRRVGPYRVLGKLGEGGMGLVLLAEQHQPVERKVALKLIRRGIETDGMLSRFRQESRLLARMNHPYIAQIYDAGVSQGGRSYVAMEHVEGEPITDYCDRLQLDIASRLELFRQVCLGIQHAHQRGIVHRDIKPSNVLVGTVDGRAVPKIIDFGIAKALDLQPAHRPPGTTFSGLIGTPEYMSPEQAGPSLRVVDKRTDVYSLGVLLCELLVGVLPSGSVRVNRARFRRLRVILDESEPPRLSLLALDGEGAVGRAEARGEASPSGLAKRLRGDLDWIAMRALERDPERRYASAGELAIEVARFSRREPVSAAPPSRMYWLRKIAARHHTVLALSTLLLFILCGSSIFLWVLHRRVEDEHERAEGPKRTLARVYDYLEQPDVPWALVELSRIMLGENHPRTLALEIDIAAELVTVFSLEHAEPLLLDLRNRVQASLFPDDPLTLRVELLLGRLYTRQRRPAEAEPLIRATLQSMERTLGADDPWTLEATSYLGSHYGWVARWQEAETILRHALPRMRRVLGDLHATVLATKYNLACAAAQRGDRDCAIDYLREAVEGGFEFGYRGEDDTVRTNWRGIMADPDLASLHGDRDFENLLQEGGYVALLGAAEKEAVDYSPGDAKRLFKQALDRGLGHPEWIPRLHLDLAWLVDDPEFGPILAGGPRVPPPRCTYESD